MGIGLFGAGLGLLGLVLGTYGLYSTITTRTAVLRGGRKVSLQRNPPLYWTNFTALCVLVAVSIGLIYLGLKGLGVIIGANFFAVRSGLGAPIPHD
jgi:predicted Co/Zn/Cd cation transporter (cation efflux family)